MASALCTKCLAEFHWEARRGMRLANVTSPCCGVAGRGMRDNKRRSAFLAVERYGSLEDPEQWTWRGQRLWVYLLANGNIQLDNRAIYRPDAQYADARAFVYAGSDPFMADYQLRMREREYRDLCGEQSPVVAVAGGIGPFGMIAVGIPARYVEGGDD